MGIIQIPITDMVLWLLPFVGSFVWWSLRQDSRIRVLEVKQDQYDKNFAELKADVGEIKEMLHELKERFARMDAIQDVKQKINKGI